MYSLGKYLYEMLTKEKTSNKPRDSYEAMMRALKDKNEYTTEDLRLYNLKSLEDAAFERLRVNRQDDDEEETELTPYIYTGTTAPANAQTPAPPSLPIPYPTSPSESKSIWIDSKLLPIIVVTVFFGGVFIIGPLLVRKGKNKGIIRACIMMTAFCMWIFWFIVYVGQMNPLVGPRLENSTVAWIAYKWGKPVQE